MWALHLETGKTSFGRLLFAPLGYPGSCSWSSRKCQGWAPSSGMGLKLEWTLLAFITALLVGRTSCRLKVWRLVWTYTVFNAHKIQPHAPCSKTPESDSCFWLAFACLVIVLGMFRCYMRPVTLQHKNPFNVTMHSCLEFIICQVQVWGPKESVHVSLLLKMN